MKFINVNIALHKTTQYIKVHKYKTRISMMESVCKAMIGDASFVLILAKLKPAL